MAKQDDIAALEKQVTELTEKLDTAVKAQGTDTEAKAALQKQLDDLRKELETAKSENETLKAKAEMDDEDKEYLEDEKDDEKKKAFAKMSKDERKAVLAKRKTGDESVKIEGVEIFKSKVGPEQFEIFKKQAARIEKAEKDLAASNERAEMSELRKRADDEFPHVPGDSELRAKMLKAMKSMSEDVQKGFEAVFKAHEALAKTAFSKLGHNGGKNENETVAKAGRDFEAKVTEIAKRDNIGRSEAMTKARTEHPELFKAYNEAGEQAEAN